MLLGSSQGVDFIYIYFFYFFINLIFLLIWLLSHTILHELTHYISAIHFHKVKGIILLQSKKEKVILKLDNLCIAKTPLIHYRGLTLLDDNYISFNDTQLKKIAIFPRIIQIAYYMILKIGVLYCIFLLHGKLYSFFYLIDFIFLLYVILFSLRKGSTGWNDINIYLNPSGYRDYAATSLSEDEKYEYWRKHLCI